MALWASCLFRRSAARVAPDESGASAIEFALVAPILVLAALATVDVGTAIGHKMDIDQSLRAASEGAMLDLGRDGVEDLAKAVAAENSTIADPSAGEPSAGDLEVTVDRFCACPESMSAAVDCAAGECTDSARPYLYYRLTAEKELQSMLLPDIPVRGSVLVQVE
jgi:pilus assembly protein CpaE